MKMFKIQSLKTNKPNQIKYYFKNALPCVEIKIIKLKVFNDTGNSILRPSIAGKYYPNKIYFAGSTINTTLAEKDNIKRLYQICQNYVVTTKSTLSQ